MEINKLINLQRLILADNRIENLPVNLGLLKSLKVATLDGNRIRALPDELGQLVKLERLSVSANLLMSLPETIGRLQNGPAAPGRGWLNLENKWLYCSWCCWTFQTIS
ncbi:hypothetical protein AABB24_039971 [Solanum stoloniferum]